MPEKPEQVLETIKKRELDIEIMELQLKHGLTKKRAEFKLLIMYHKAYNTMLKAKLMMHGAYGHNCDGAEAPSPPFQIEQRDTLQQREGKR